MTYKMILFSVYLNNIEIIYNDDNSNTITRSYVAYDNTSWLAGWLIVSI